MKTLRKGLSLIEVTITLALIISIMTGIIQIIAQASKVKMKVDQLNLITLHLVNFLEDLRSSELKEIQSFVENEDEIIDPHSREKFSCRWKLIPESPLAYRVEVRIESETHRERKIEVTLWLLPILGF